MSVPRRIILDLDEQDWDTIQAEFSRRQGGPRLADGWPASVPDGESNLAGAMLAEIVRGFTEYHELYLAQIEKQRAGVAGKVTVDLQWQDSRDYPDSMSRLILGDYGITLAMARSRGFNCGEWWYHGEQVHLSFDGTMRTKEECQRVCRQAVMERLGMKDYSAP